MRKDEEATVIVRATSYTKWSYSQLSKAIVVRQEMHVWLIVAPPLNMEHEFTLKPTSKKKHLFVCKASQSVN